MKNLVRLNILLVATVVIVILFKWDTNFHQLFSNRHSVIPREIIKPINKFLRSITVYGLAGPYIASAAGVFLLFRVLTSLSKRVSFRFLSKAIKNSFVAKLDKWNAVFLLSLLTAGLACMVLKVLFGRQRPYLRAKHYDPDMFQPLTLNWDFHSFPSGHSQVAFTVATALGFLMPQLRWLWFFAALVIALSRVSADFHYLSDVIFGGGIGYTATYLCYQRFRTR